MRRDIKEKLLDYITWVEILGITLNFVASIVKINRKYGKGE